MKITPLQWHLLNKTVPHHLIRHKTGRGRATVWRWATGKSYPTRATAEKLVELFGADRLSLQGCYEASLALSDAEASELRLLPGASGA